MHALHPQHTAGSATPQEGPVASQTCAQQQAIRVADQTGERASMKALYEAWWSAWKGSQTIVLVSEGNRVPVMPSLDERTMDSWKSASRRCRPARGRRGGVRERTAATQELKYALLQSAVTRTARVRTRRRLARMRASAHV
jgi:hypothetical protein